MVLPDADQSSADSFNDNPYPSDNDQYSSSSSSPPPSGSGETNFHIETSGFPRPIPLVAPLLGYSERIMRDTTTSTLAYAQIRVKRPLTREETQALAYHVYQAHSTASYITATGVAVGAARWYQTMGKNQYPMYTPKPETINPNQFMFVKGAMAQQARRSWRFLVWTVFAGTMGRFVGLAYAQPTAAREVPKDPKLAQFVQDLQQAIAEDRTNRPKEIPHAGAPKIFTPRKTPAAAPAPAPASSDDDMSPTAGNESWPSQGSYDSAFAPDPVEKQPGQPSPSPARSPYQPERRPTRPADADDMSPTDGMFQEEAQYQPKPGESSWERLRRGGPPPGQSPHPPPARRPDPLHRNEPRERSNMSDSFTSSDSGEERKRAREQAQREFDERLERERQGKDFSDDKKW